MSMNPPPYPFVVGQQPQYQPQYQQQQEPQEQQPQQPMQQPLSYHQLPQLAIPAPPPGLQFQPYQTFAPQAPMLTSPSSTVHTLPHPYHYPGFQYQQQAQQIPQSISPLPPQSTSPKSLSQLPLRQFTSTPIVPLQQHHDDRSSKTPSTSGSSAILSPYNVSSAGSMAQIAKKPIERPIEKPKFSTTTTTTPSAPATTSEPLVHSYDVANIRGGSIISYDSNGHVTKPRVTTTMWEDEKTLCYQVEANGVSVVRRADNDMINGTKLLNVAKITRGRRDGILKAERIRHVVKIGSMHLKGVWIPFERAQVMAEREKIADYLYPLFVKDIQSVLKETSNHEDERMSRINSPPNDPMSSLNPPSQGPMSLHPPNTYDPWYSTRNIPQPTPTTTTILPQPAQFGLPTQSRTTPPFAIQYTPAHTTIRPHPNTPNFDYSTNSSTPNPNSRLIFNQNLAPPLTSVTPTPSDTSTTTAPSLTSIRPLSVTPTASDARQQQNVMGFVPAPQPQQLHQSSSQLLRSTSGKSDTTDRSTSDSDGSKND
ncbi:hypothetical protein ZYGR_0P02430 [Zygosaccharomyces rouxii]|uniref:ZYRO0E06248p n=2 Tax=Zygosaccharomyces rouxii TaxID=4956 RepID=C5E4H8_ZYGRC|nr:uncharacterized protein ZYRO0E06248g [Zygosaccharomyces rouxii]KAH9198203.1 hypothetical protein LQ764DRAFT_226648 [Zygosaccharomyces rouxii]GAV49598.1 hypothetical protein ZYGR_0P02430 [Zygosaccharomyces rouxii]CAR30939.1 ZYRO0E06248p [Zygosaccharomyces rouxii]